MHQQTLFSTEIYKDQVKDHERIKDFFIKNIESEYNDKGPNCNFCNVYSDYFANAVSVDWDDLFVYYEPTISKFIKHFGFDTDTVHWNIGIDAWYNVTGKGGYGEIHNHLSSPRTIQICAVHYVKYDPKVHSPTIFYNPSADGLRSTQPTPNTTLLPKLWPQETVYADVKEGDMIFFPPYLNHSIPKQSTADTRITTAFNITITEK